MIRTLLLLLACTVSLGASASLESDLQYCAGIGEDAARLACFDTLAGGGNAVDEEYGEPKKLTDSVGRREFHQEIAEETYAILVTACEKRNNRVYFSLDNGQVWRQSNSKWMSLRNCGGAGTITRDFWGYMLTIDAMSETLRVNRAR